MRADADLVERDDRRASDDDGEQPTATILQVEGIAKSFGHRAAITDIGFALVAREIVAVLGPSGAGKTTLFRCLTGLLTPDRGRVVFNGTDMARLMPTDRHLLAMVFQDYNLVRRLTAFENVLGGRLGQVAPWRGMLRRFEHSDKRRAFECLERVGMLDHAHQRADTLSGGQQQRVAIARALAQEARLIVADEPVASLDPAAAAGVLQLLGTIARSDGVAVICSLHQVGYARTYCDRIIGLVGGRIAVDKANHDLSDADCDALYASQAAPDRPKLP